jgi:hypothetical protein
VLKGEPNGRHGGFKWLAGWIVGYVVAWTCLRLAGALAVPDFASLPLAVYLGLLAAWPLVKPLLGDSFVSWAGWSAVAFFLCGLVLYVLHVRESVYAA